MKKLVSLFGIFPAVFCAATISDLSLSQREDGIVVVTYSLDADAVVTADFRNQGVSLGASRHWSLDGDVNRLVAAGAGKQITWHPAVDVPGENLPAVTVELKAWAESDPPDYMVADLLTTTACRIRYYPTADHLPGGIVSNEQYRMYYMPFRKIKAKNVTWTMGTTKELGRATGGEETAHEVTLDHNYFIGVFEVTKAQCEAVGSTKSADCTHSGTSRWRLTPSGRITWNTWRGTLPPAAPGETSVCGKFTARIGFAVDLPLESQWEFAARGGHGEGTWGDGSQILKTESSDSNLNRLSINAYHIGTMTETGTCEPNSYGLYDMHGNIGEFCRDWYQKDITALNGALCVSSTDPSRRADGIVGTNRVIRGGYWTYKPKYVRASYRTYGKPGEFKTERGVRLVTLANLGAEVAPAAFVSEESLAIDTRLSPPDAAVSAAPVARRTYHSVLSDAFALDTLTPPGLILILR